MSRSAKSRTATKSTKASTAKTATAKAAKASSTKAESRPAIEANWRVLRLSESQRDSFKNFRDAHDLTNQDTISLLVDQQLPVIVSTLIGLGCGKVTGPTRPMRCPFSDSALSGIKAASQQTGVPAALLFRCLLGQLQHISDKPSKATKADKLVNSAESNLVDSIVNAIDEAPAAPKAKRGRPSKAKASK